MAPEKTPVRRCSREEMLGRRSSVPITVALSPSAEKLNVAAAVSNDMEVIFHDTLGRFALLVVGVFLAVGTSFFSIVEGWTPVDSLYFCVITVTTVGFGDFVPTCDASKIFVAIYILVGLSLFSTCLGVLVGKLHGAVEQPASQLPRRRRYAWQVLACSAITLFWLAFGAAVVRCMEGWSVVDCIYWAVVATCTVGYGDLEISRDDTRLVLALYMLLAVSGCAVSLGKLGALSMTIERERDVDAFLMRGVSEEMLEAMDADGNGVVDRGEFLKAMLIVTGKVDHEDVDKVLRLFDALDANRTGVLELRQQRGKLVRSFSGGGRAAERGLQGLAVPLLREDVAS